MSLSRRLSAALAAWALALPVAVLAGTAQAATPEDVPPPPAAEDVQGPDPLDPNALTWGVTPAPPAGDPDAERVSFRYVLDPGESVDDHLAVTNYSLQPATFGLLASDGVVTREGVFDLLPSDVAPTDVGTWVAIQESVAVAPGETAVVPFTVTVPPDATPGDHPGGIVAFVSSTSEDAAGPQVGVNTRVGARIHLRVAGEITPALRITDVSTTWHGGWNPFGTGDLDVLYTVRNDGNIRIGSIQQAWLNGPFDLPTGAVAPSGTVVGQQRELLPGQSVTIRTTMRDAWPLVRMDLAMRASYERVAEDSPLGRIDPASLEVRVWVVPWPQLAVLAALLLLVAALVWRHRRRADRMTALLAAARAEGAREASRGPDDLTSDGPVLDGPGADPGRRGTPGGSASGGTPPTSGGRRHGGPVAEGNPG